MIRLAIPVILIIVTLGLFFGYIDPTYTLIKELRAEEKTYDEALNQSRELQEIRDSLLSRYNTFSQQDLNRLEKLLPNHVDNVRLILDIDSIASNYNMRTRNVTISEVSSEDKNVIGANQNAVDSVVLSFSVAATYENFIRFIKDLESSLRIVDFVGLSFSATEGDAFNFNISIRTYWLK
ncbi:type 4a pilus biogenesis protein PilO [Candidatus Kaiserbacteria bacterium]|nr:type 4a pilus biogenesis protein PilO [Candidatus Kaiserbacteria bacterium]